MASHLVKWLTVIMNSRMNVSATASTQVVLGYHTSDYMRRGAGSTYGHGQKQPTHNDRPSVRPIVRPSRVLSSTAVAWNAVAWCAPTTNSRQPAAYAIQSTSSVVVVVVVLYAVQ